MSTTTGMTVLTVDDSRTMREMLSLALRDAGYRVVQAEDGVHGLEVLAAEKPDVIVTDINMPRLDGFGFIEEVRSDESHRAIPILVLTTESDAEKKTRARMAGATGWIVKPFNPVKLVDAIRRVAPF
jgi:two-component system chemotaxis response regulator CheY